MSPEARMEYLESIVIRYRKASKNKKTAILNPNNAISIIWVNTVRNRKIFRNNC